MILSIQIQNFQSHDDSTLEFHPGVNSIIGSSDCGKSAILRALFWAINNRPLGVSFVSHWNRNPKTKDPIKETSVSIKKPELPVLKRFKDKDSNGYMIGTKKLEAISTDIPADVQKYFNFTDVNIQRQMDPPFLLSASTGDVAKFLNKIINLELIDTVLAEAELRRRRAKTNVEELTKQKDRLEEQLQGFSWVAGIKAQVQTAQNLNDRIERFTERKTVLSDERRKYQVLVETKHLLEEILDLEPKITNAQKLDEKLQKSRSNLKLLQSNLEQFRAQKAWAGLVINPKIQELCVSIPTSRRALKALRESLASFEENQDLVDIPAKVPELLEMVEALTMSLKNDKSQLNRLVEALEEYKLGSLTIQEQSDLMKALKAERPEKCETCGRPFDEEHDHAY